MFGEEVMESARMAVDVFFSRRGLQAYQIEANAGKTCREALLNASEWRRPDAGLFGRRGQELEQTELADGLADYLRT